MRFRKLSDWLTWQEGLHPKKVDLGLERCRAVAERMGMTAPWFPIVSVAGTNGKGSSVALMEGIFRAAGYRVGSYTSPHLVRYNERVRIGGKEVEDETLVEAFARIDEQRRETSLTYFEFGTLAAMDVFRNRNVDVAVLEVGMGGRLDAVNLFDADVAMVTAVDIDHVDWLGHDRETIGREKAGIFRARRPAVCADSNPPVSLERHARALGTSLFCLGRDFHYETQQGVWHWCAGGTAWRNLARPGLAGEFQLRNAAGVLMVLELLRGMLAVTRDAVVQGIRDTLLPGRFQISPGPVERIFDVAHNPQSAGALAELLRDRPCQGRTFAVLGMLGDKALGDVARAVMERVDAWYVAPVNSQRSATARDLRDVIAAIDPGKPVQACNDIPGAYGKAVADARAGDRVVVFGSFYTVGEILGLG